MGKLFAGLRRTTSFQILKNKAIYGVRALEYNSVNFGVKKEDRPIYIFNHVPKCGGTSLNRIFRKWFCVIRDYPPHDLKYPDREEQERELQTFIASKPDYLSLKPWELIAGHYHLPELEVSLRFPDVFNKKNTRVIAFIRDPLKHRLSHYYYGIRRGHAYMKGVELEDFLLNSQRNFIAQSLGCNEHNYKERIDQYFFIGDMDNYKESILALSRLIGKKTPKIIPHTNQTKKEKSSSQLDFEVVEKFKEFNKLEYLVIEYAKKRANQFIKESGEFG